MERARETTIPTPIPTYRPASLVHPNIPPRIMCHYFGASSLLCTYVCLLLLLLFETADNPSHANAKLLKQTIFRVASERFEALRCVRFQTDNEPFASKPSKKL